MNSPQFQHQLHGELSVMDLLMIAIQHHVIKMSTSSPVFIDLVNVAMTVILNKS